MNILLLWVEPHVAFMFFNEQKRDNAWVKNGQIKRWTVHDAPKINISKLLRNLPIRKKSTQNLTYFDNVEIKTNRKSLKIETAGTRGFCTGLDAQIAIKHHDHIRRISVELLFTLNLWQDDGVSPSKSLNGLLYWNLLISRPYRMFNIDVLTPIEKVKWKISMIYNHYKSIMRLRT